ncbi:MAG TPA: flavin reductase family protein [Acidimicrobiia bacterium]|nr:flavin reductase family protein [Acidimicrobiia bacterium]
MTKVVFDLAETESRDSYKLLSGLVVPRPIGWIGTRREDGSNNLAPFSFFNVVSTNPPVVLFSAGSHSDRPKDSSTIAEISGEFTVNIVSEDVVEAMSITSGSFTAVDDEFAIAGLTAVEGTKVSAPLVAESPANLECRVRRVIDLGGEGRTKLVVGDVMVIHVEQSVLDGTRVDNDALRAVGRMAGTTYISTRDRFDVVRPR